MNKIDFLMGKLNYISKALGGEGVNEGISLSIQFRRRRRRRPSSTISSNKSNKAPIKAESYWKSERILFAKRAKNLDKEFVRLKLTPVVDNEIREIVNQGRANHEKCRVLLRKQKKEQKV